MDKQGSPPVVAWRIRTWA